MGRSVGVFGWAVWRDRFLYLPVEDIVANRRVGRNEKGVRRMEEEEEEECLETFVKQRS